MINIIIGGGIDICLSIVRHKCMSSRDKHNFAQHNGKVNIVLTRLSKYI